MSFLLQSGPRQGENARCRWKQQRQEELQPTKTDEDRLICVVHLHKEKFKCCFSLQVNQQRQKLHDLQTLIDNLGSGQDTVSDKAFEDRLKEAERAIMELLEEAQTSKGNKALAGLSSTSEGEAAAVT